MWALHPLWSWNPPTPTLSLLLCWPGQLLHLIGLWDLKADSSFLKLLLSLILVATALCDPDQYAESAAQWVPGTLHLNTPWDADNAHTILASYASCLPGLLSSMDTLGRGENFRRRKISIYLGAPEIEIVVSVTKSCLDSWSPMDYSPLWLCLWSLQADTGMINMSPPVDFPDSRIRTRALAQAGGFLTTELSGKPLENEI